MADGEYAVADKMIVAGSTQLNTNCVFQSCYVYKRVGTGSALTEQQSTDSKDVV